MELSAYLLPLRRWWWLLVVSTLVAAVSSFIATRDQPPVYQASTTLMVGRVIDDPNPNQGEIFLAQSLAQTYADIANREPVRNATMQALDLNRLPAYRARALPQTQVLEIAVTDVNPLRAQVVANELAHQLILRSPTGAGSEDQQRQQFINDQLNILQAQIEETQGEIAKLQEELGTLNSARQIADTQAQINALQNKLTTIQGNYAALLANTQQGAANTLTVVESAGLPSNPIGPNKRMSILLSAAVGLSLAVGAAYLLEYLDDTVKSPKEITQTLGVPILGFIGETGKKGDNKEVYVSKHPRSPTAEAYRSLRANLEFANKEVPLRTILIVSTDPEAGKTSVTTNLAATISQGEKNVLLMDADLRKPSIHSYANLPNDVGLSNILLYGINLFDALKYWKDNRIWVVTSGKPPPNPAELLASGEMNNILADSKMVADMVFIDSPPLVVSDALTLAAKVDGVLLVIRPGHTRKKSLVPMMEQLNRAEARVIGAVFNRIPRGKPEYYGNYSYYSPYYDGYYASDGYGEYEEHAPGLQTNEPLKKKRVFILKPLVTAVQKKIATAIKNVGEKSDRPSVNGGGDKTKNDISN